MRLHPLVLELDARRFLLRQSLQYGQQLTLATIPAEVWEGIAGLGFDSVWLMGIWQRSPGARQVALTDHRLREEYSRALPGWTEADVQGSPYAVHAYELDEWLGTPLDLAEVRRKLHRAGLALIVDFVPNHLALDHPWTAEHPDRFVRGSVPGTGEDASWSYTAPSGNLLAHGRDPYFGPWTDTVQVDFFSEELRATLTHQLLRIAGLADGVRCDMAMLGINDVFDWLWGSYTPNQKPRDEFWARAVGVVRAKFPDFVFIAEAYWGHEPQLQSLGFDYTYDKVLYDRLRWDGAGGVRGHLHDQWASSKWVRFVENHDEERAAHVFGRERSRAAAVVAATLPGLRLFYEGQTEGRSVRTPVQLIRMQEETPDDSALVYYRNLLNAVSEDVFHTGTWQHLDPVGETSGGLLTWEWRLGAEHRLVAVNYTPESAALQVPGLAAGWRDELSGETFPFGESETVQFNPWQARILRDR